MASMSANDALGMLGIQIEDFPEKKTTKEVCICGHPEARHYINGDMSLCKPTVMDCSCAQYRGVIRAEDTRYFQYKTNGPGVDHALSKGLKQSAKKNRTVEWLEDAYKCALCEKQETLQIYPISGSEKIGFHIATDPKVDYDMGRRNALLCEGCVETL